MSASTDRKIRKEAIASGLDRKTKAKLEEELKKQKSKRKWTIGSVIAVVVVIAILIMGSSIPYKTTTAVTVNGEKYTPAEVNYYIGAQYVNFMNTYGQYASMFGLNPQYGVAGLADQEYYDGTTWLQYFAEQAVAQISQIQALCDYAKANGITLDESEKADVEAQISQIGEYAKESGYKNADAFLALNYGTGVTAKVARECMLNSTLASKAYSSYQESLEYTDAALEEYYAGLNGDSDYFEYVYFIANAETVAVKGEDEEETEEVTDETMAAAKTAAEAVLAAYSAADEAAVIDRLNAAIETAGEEGTAVASGKVAGSSLGAYADFLKGSVSEGDAQVIETAGNNGYAVVAFVSRDDNHYNTAAFRHILINAEKSEDGSYSDEALAMAKSQIDEIYAEYLAGAQTEESFAELANTYSQDAGSNTNGGLYENVSNGQMVPEINSFLFEQNAKPGDVITCVGESSAYKGYHLVYYVGDGELFSNTIARNGLQSADVSAWLEEITAGYEAVNGFGYRYVD